MCLYIIGVVPLLVSGVQSRIDVRSDAAHGTPLGDNVMKQSNNLNDPLFLAPLLERFFIDRLMRQRDVSPHTVVSYRDSFRLLLSFVSLRLGLVPAQLLFEQIDAPLVTEFLEDLEVTRNVSVRTRNLRLTAVRSFFRYASYELFPAHATQIQRVLAIPDKRFERKQIGFLSRDQVDALLQAPDRTTWTGRRDHAFILTAVQTGLRVSELTALKREDMIMGVSSHVRVIGKGRKRRCTPLAKPTCAVLNAWMSEPERGHQNILFPSINGEQLTVHGVQHLLKKHQATAQTLCPSLKHQRVTVHLLATQQLWNCYMPELIARPWHYGLATKTSKQPRFTSRQHSN